ncbi:MAG: argininosuccinate lyase [Chloroflexota bacterium]
MSEGGTGPARAKQWGGRFEGGVDPLVEEFTASVHVDGRLLLHDIAGSRAHARMLGATGIISATDATALETGLQAIRAEVEAGTFALDPRLEDVHTNVEAALRTRVGEVAGKLHTARSRNDQVALDIRLYTREVIARTLAGLADLREGLVTIAAATVDLVMPGYTHLQRAQPVSVAHHLLAYVEMFRRDTERFEGCYTRTDVLPLGSGALAGVPYPIDRQQVARELRFATISRNSMDAVADRDFLIEYCAAASLLMMHLSRFCEEIILWCSAEFAFWELDDAFATGSSIMPQKKNPDVAELVRGKTGRVYGHLVALLTVLKGLPLAYNRDLQEDKEAFFDTSDTVLACLRVFPGMLRALRPRAGAMRSAAGNLLCATDVADYLARKGLPFRQAHEVTGRIVRHALATDTALQDLDLATYRTFSPLFADDLYAAITPEASVAARAVTGGTAPGEVRHQIEAARAAERARQRPTSLAAVYQAPAVAAT